MASSRPVRSVTVAVAGTKLALRTDARAAYLKELATFVSAKIAANQRLHGQRRGASAHGMALLTALHLADELMQLQRRHRALEGEVKERTHRILAYLEELAPRRPEPARRRSS